MSAEINVFHAVDLVTDGQRTGSFGSMLSSVMAKTLTAGTSVVKRRIVVPADTELALWEWADTNGFELFAAVIVGGEGYLRFAHQVQSTVDGDDDQTPDGDPVWHHRDMSCFAPVYFDSDRVMSHATDGTVNGDTAGAPSLWAATTFDGVISKIMVKNEDTEESVTLDIFIVQ